MQNNTNVSEHVTSHKKTLHDVTRRNAAQIKSHVTQQLQTLNNNFQQLLLLCTAVS